MFHLSHLPAHVARGLVFAVLTGALAACGGGSSDSSGATPAALAPAPAPAPTKPTPPTTPETSVQPEMRCAP